MEKLTPLQIRKIAEIIALPSGMYTDPNYLTGQKLVDLFNAFDFGDEYRYPSTGIVTKDIGESLSRQKYVFERLNKLMQLGKITEAIELFLNSVQEPIEAQRKIV